MHSEPKKTQTTVRVGSLIDVDRTLQSLQE